MIALPLTAEQAVWLERQAARLGGGRVFDIKTRDKAVNPCLQFFGAGPAGARCKECSRLYRSGRFFKCGLRAHSNGAGTDHKAGWPACGKFAPDLPGQGNKEEAA